MEDVWKVFSRCSDTKGKKASQKVVEELVCWKKERKSGKGKGYKFVPNSLSATQ
jgi:hypothetical protein